MQTVTIAPHTAWGGTFEVLEIIRRFKNGKIAIRVRYHGGTSVFHVHPEDITEAA